MLNEIQWEVRGGVKYAFQYISLEKPYDDKTSW